MKSGILTAYFVRRDEARTALRQLGRKGFRRAALIHKSTDGRARTLDLFTWRRAFAAAASAALLGAIAGAAFLVFHWSWPGLRVTPSIEASIPAAALLGALLGLALMRRERFGVERRLLA